MSHKSASFYRVCIIKLCNESVDIPWSTEVGRGVSISASDGGSIIIGKGAQLSFGVKVVSQYGKIDIANNAFFGVGVMIVCTKNISIGDDALIAEYVVIRDQDHSLDSKPYNLAGFKSSSITIGDNVWIGCKSSVLRSANIGDNSIIGAHSLVRGNIPEMVVAVGAPAKVIRCLI